MKIFKTRKKTRRLKAVIEKYKVRMHKLERHLKTAVRNYKESVEAERVAIAKKANGRN